MTLDGTVKQKDTPQTGDASKGKQETPEKAPETFAKEQVQEIAQKAASDALAKAGRTAKAFEQREEAIKAREEKHTDEVRARRERELENVQDDASALTKVRAKHKLEEVNSELAKLKSELEAEREKGKQRDGEVVVSTQERNAREIATHLNVEEKTLLALSKRTDGSKEAIEEIAQALPKLGEPKKPVTPDSGKTLGGGTLTVEQVKQMSPAEQRERISDIAKLPLGIE